MSFTATVAPSCANRSQTALPIPDPPPVTIATFPSSLIPPPAVGCLVNHQEGRARSGRDGLEALEEVRALHPPERCLPDPPDGAPPPERVRIHGVQPERRHLLGGRLERHHSRAGAADPGGLPPQPEPEEPAEGEVDL